MIVIGFLIIPIILFLPTLILLLISVRARRSSQPIKVMFAAWLIALCILEIYSVLHWYLQHGYAGPVWGYLMCIPSSIWLTGPWFMFAGARGLRGGWLFLPAVVLPFVSWAMAWSACDYLGWTHGE